MSSTAIDAIGDTLAALVDGGEPAAVPKLVAMGVPALERLIALMAGRIALPSAVDWRDRNAAVQQALEAFARKDLVSVLAAIAARGWEDSYDVVSTLGRITDSRVVPLLLRSSTSKDSTLRGFAINGLARQRDPRATEVLISALRDRSPEIRLTAAKSLGDTGDHRAVEPLEKVATAKQNARYPGILSGARASLAKLRG